MNAKSKLAMIAMSGLMFDPFNERGVRIESRTEIPKKPYKDVQIKNGLKEFIIDGVTVMALNEKNAIRKASKLPSTKRQ